MAVYMIRAGAHGPVKIGHSHTPTIRLSQLQVSHWEVLTLIRQFEGGEAEEITLHLRFADLHIRGEWHSFSRTMMGDIGLIEIFPIPAPAPFLIQQFEKVLPTRAPVDVAISKAGSVKALGALCGIKPQAISQWRCVPVEHVKTIEILTCLSKHDIRPDVYEAAA